MRLATLQFEIKLQKCIRMGITIFKNFHLGRYIVGYTFGNHVLQLRSRVAVKLTFRPYIRQYTSPNENFEYSYPLSINPFPANHNNYCQLVQLLTCFCCQYSKTCVLFCLFDLILYLSSTIFQLCKYHARINVLLKDTRQ